MRRRALRLLIIAGCLLLLAMIAVQALLFTSVPRNIVVSQIEQELGLRMTAESASTGWFGRTTLRNVTLSLPLGEHPLLEAPELRARHTGLVPLLLGRKFRLTALELEHPQARVTQAPGGRWNLQDAMDLVEKTTGPPGPSSSGPPRLPAIEVIDGTIVLTDRAGRSAVVSPLRFSGAADSALSWKFDASVPSRLRITGRVAPGNNWRQEADIQLDNVIEWARPWLPGAGPFTLDASWRGEVAAGRFAGRAQVRDFHERSAGGIEVRAAGGIGLAAQDAGLDLRPDNLQLSTSLKSLPDARLVSGRISITASGVRAESVMLNAYGGPGRVDGAYDLNADSGEFQVAWNELLLPGGIRHSGTLGVTIRRPFPRDLLLNAHLNSRGSAPGGTWEGRIDLSSEGAGWTDMDWQMTAPVLGWSGSRAMQLDGLQLAGHLENSTLTLRSAAVPGDKHLRGEGAYDFSTEQWRARVSGDRWPVQLSEAPLSFNLAASGERSRARLEGLTLRGSGAEVSANGYYVYNVPKPVDLNVSVRSFHAEPAQAAAALLLRGDVDGSAQLRGALFPQRDIAVSGTLKGKNVLLLGHHSLGDIDLKFSGTIDSERADLHTEALTLLGGHWDLEGFYFGPARGAGLNVRVQDLSLKQAAALFNQPGVDGTADGAWTVYLPALNFAPAQIEGSGQVKLAYVKAPFLTADSISANTSLRGGVVKVADLHLTRAEYGRADGWLTYDLASRHLAGAVSSAAWPVDVPGAVAHLNVWAEAPNLAADLPRGRPIQFNTGAIDVRSSVLLNDQPAGLVRVVATIEGRAVNVSEISGKLLGGKVEGSASGDLDQPVLTRGKIRVAGADLGIIPDFCDAAKGLNGSLTASLLAEPDLSPRALAPLKVTLSGQTAGGRFRGIPVKQFQVIAYASADHVVLGDRLADNFILMDGGEVRFWGRTSRGQRGRPRSSLAQITMKNLDLNSLVRAGDSAAPPTPGKLDGAINLLHAARAPGVPSDNSSKTPTQIFVEQLNGDATIEVTDSNLGNLRVFSLLYNLMHLGIGSGRPTGAGTAFFHLERGTLDLTSLHYFNKGTEALVVATMPKFWLAPDCPVNGTAVGYLRPLANIKLPLISDVDRLLSALQADATPIQFTGPLRNPVPTPISFRDIGAGMERLLLGDVQSN